MHPTLQAVFDTVAVGCGVDRPELIPKIRRFQRLLRDAGALRSNFPAETPLGALLRLGIQDAGVRLNHHWLRKNGHVHPARSERALGDALPYNPEILAWLQYLGRALVQSSKGCLTPKLVELAARWRHGSAGEQRAIAADVHRQLAGDTFGSVMRTLVGDAGPKLVPSMLSTPTFDDYLPRCYGPLAAHHPKESRSCLMNALLLAAFGSLARTRAMIAMPLVSEQSQFDGVKSIAAAEMLRVFDQRGFPLSRERREALERVVTFPGHPTSCHLPIALELRDGRWILLDPNFHVVGCYSSSWNISGIAQLLDETSPVLPGLSIVAEDPNREARRQAALRSIHTARAQLDAALEWILAARGRSTGDLVELLAQSEILSNVAHWLRAFHLVPHDASRRRTATFVLLHYFFDEDGYRNLPEGLFDEDKHRAAYWKFYSDWARNESEEVLLAQFGKDEAFAALLQIAYRFARNSVMNLAALRLSGNGDGESVHPRCQLSRAEFGLGVAVTSYTGLLLGEETRALVDATLRGYAFDQLLLVYAAHDLFEGRRTNELSASIRTLKALPIQIGSAAPVVRALTELGLVA